MSVSTIIDIYDRLSNCFSAYDSLINDQKIIK